LAGHSGDTRDGVGFVGHICKLSLHESQGFGF
jgi:hypothetical protein